MKSTRGGSALVWVFIATLSAPWIDALVRDSALRGPAGERRSAAPTPEWPRSSAELMRFPGEVERHFADTFGLRDVLLRWNSLQMLQLFRKFPSPSAVLGKDGYLFYTGESSVPILRGQLPFSVEEQRDWYKQIESHRLWCAERGITYLLVIAPNKETIYPEKLPTSWDRVGPTRLEQFLELLPRGLANSVLDLRPALLADKQLAGEREPLYFPLSTHCTDRGSLVAACEISRALAREHPALQPLALEDFEARASERPGESWAPKANLPRWMHQHVLAREPRDGTRARKLGSNSQPYGCVRYACSAGAPLAALVIHDSSGPRVCEYLAERCARLVSASWYGLDEALIEREKPDLVIELYVERKLLGPGPRMSRVAVKDSER